MPDDTVAGEYRALWRCEINNASTDSEIGTVSGSPWVLQNFPNMDQLRLYAAWVPGAKAEASSCSACRVSAAMLGERGCWQERDRPLAPMPGTFPPADEIESRPSCFLCQGCELLGRGCCDADKRVLVFSSSSWLLCLWMSGNWWYLPPPCCLNETKWLIAETICPETHGQHNGVELQQCNGLTPPLIIPGPEQPLGAEDSTVAQCSRRDGTQVYAGGL